MKSFKGPSFQERVGRAAEAKQKALDALRAKAPPDPAVVAERQAARLKREEAAAEKRAAKKRDAESAKAARDAAKAEAPPAPAPEPSEAERKAARDARYAARKNRK